MYRAVSSNEFYSITKLGKFNVVLEGMEAKQFGLNPDETLIFVNQFKNIGAKIEVIVPKKELEKIADITQVDTFIFKSGIITIHLDKIDNFNKIINNIKHII